MLRTLAAVVVGYLVIALFIFATFSLVYAALGPSFAFRPGTVDVTAGWMVVATVLNVVAAILGGLVAAKIGRSPAAVNGLAGLVLVLGVVSAVLVMNAPAKALPDRPLTTMEAAAFAKQPTWYSFLLPVIGVAGVLIGGSLAKKKRDGAATPAAA